MWGHVSVSGRAMQRWFEKFRYSEFDIGDEFCRGRPYAIEGFEWKRLMEANKRATVLELAEKRKLVWISVVLGVFNKVVELKALGKLV